MSGSHQTHCTANRLPLNALHLNQVKIRRQLAVTEYAGISSSLGRRYESGLFMEYETLCLSDTAEYRGITLDSK